MAYKGSHLALVAMFALSCVAGALAEQPAPIPSDWIDPDTGHRVIRVSPDSGGSSLYFHQNAYTDKGDKLFITVKGGLATVDLTTLGVKPCTVERIAEGKAGSPVVGKKTRTVYYVQSNAIYATHLDTHQTRMVLAFPPGYSGASGLALNADETLLASTAIDRSKEPFAVPVGLNLPTPTQWATKEGKEQARILFTVNVRTGETKKVWGSNDWLNHTQFSPTDPGQLLFCHEGTWDLVDRIWTIRTDGSGLRRMHARTMAREIAGHEFFSQDGSAVLFDLQTPRSTEFWVAGVSVQNQERFRYKLDRSEWSVHFNQAPGGKLYAGDGGGPNSVANRRIDGKSLDGPGNGQWIYLFKPSEQMETVHAENGNWKSGKFASEKLVNLAKHDYKLEPNVTFTPDAKWIVFRSNMHGPTHVYAVEVRKELR
jgi:oligogalacturonide lyase